MSKRYGARVLHSFVVLALAAGAASALNAADGPQSAISSDGVATAMLAMHNAERRSVGGEPLVWDPALAEAAGGYAGTLAATGIFRHSVRESRANQGENLWMGSHGAYGLPQMMDSWLSEKSLYRPGLFPDVSSDGNWQGVGHYTQVIWRATTSVGCAVRSNPGFDYLVCRYSPPGNVRGKPVN